MDGCTAVRTSINCHLPLHLLTEISHQDSNYSIILIRSFCKTINTSVCETENNPISPCGWGGGETEGGREGGRERERAGPRTGKKAK